MACMRPRLHARLSPWQEESMYKQFACHDYFLYSSQTWDLESWRRNVPWSEVYKNTGGGYLGFCNYDSSGTILSLAPSNYPHLRVKANKDEQASLAFAVGARDTRFRLVVGLAGYGYSLQQVDEDGEGTSNYLRHQNGQLVLQRAVKTGDKYADRVQELFAADASFHVRRRRDQPSQRSFRSFNYTDHYIRHYRSRLEIGTPRSRPGTPFAADRWFTIVR
jgi:hypothetical protein